jgi:hypothetical protein
MKLLFSKTKIDPNKTHDTPYIIEYPMDYYKGKEDRYKIVSGSYWDNGGNEYQTEFEALNKGVQPRQLTYEEDFLYEHVNSVYRFEKNKNDNIKIANAKKCGLGTIRFTEGEYAGLECLFPLFDTTEDPNLLKMGLVAYGYLTHGYIDLKVLKQIKKSKQFQEDLYFAIGEFGGEKLYNDIINYHPV